MSTLDGNGNLHRPAGAPGSSGGQFVHKRNNAPAGGLGDDPLPQFSPADVRNPNFTFETLRSHLGDDADLRHAGVTDDGEMIAEWATRGYGAEWQHRAHIDGNGDIVRVLDAFEKADGSVGWHDYGETHEGVHVLRHTVNVTRLAFAGVLVHGTPNDGGAYGGRYVGGRADEVPSDAAQISKRLREDLKRAQEVGAIPSNLTYRVNTDKFAGGQAVRVSVEGVPDSLQYLPDDQDPRFKRPHPWNRELVDTVEIIGNQWQDSETDSMTDYFNVRYYLSVSTPDERSMKWMLEEREKAAAKRAAQRTSGR